MAMYQNGFPVGYNPANLYNPQPTQFTQPQQSQTPQNQEPIIQDNNMIWVQGEVGAKSYMVARNTRLPLWDSEENKIYLKTSDGEGRSSYKILEYTIKEPEKPEDKFVTREEIMKYMDNKMSDVISQIKEALNGKSTVQSAE